MRQYVVCPYLNGRCDGWSLMGPYGVRTSDVRSNCAGSATATKSETSPSLSLSDGGGRARGDSSCYDTAATARQLPRIWSVPFLDVLHCDYPTQAWPFSAGRGDPVRAILPARQRCARPSRRTINNRRPCTLATRRPFPATAVVL